MNTADNPYSASALHPQFDAMTVYQESFFAVIWPSVAFSVLLLGLILIVELLTPQSAAGRSAALDMPSFFIVISGVITPLSAYIVTARRIVRSHGQRRSIQRSILIGTGITIYGVGSIVVATLSAGLVRQLFEINIYNGTAINAFVFSLVDSLLLGIMFKVCWREIRLRRFVAVTLGTTALIMLAVFSHPEMSELTKRLFFTFFCSVFIIAAHINCFAWWYATPKLERETLQQGS